MKKISLLFCLIILQAGLLCGCRLPHKSSPQKPVEGENKSGLVKVQDDKKEEKKEEKEETGKTEIVETEDTELAFLRKQINQNGCGAGVALFGYVDSEFTMTDLSFYLEFHHLTKKSIRFCQRRPVTWRMGRNCMPSFRQMEKAE